MKRTVIKIDESLCNGCGLCVKGCHEGALQLINGKAVLVSELYCDGLGACIGECPEGAIALEEREAEPYSETAVMERIVAKGEAVVLAHLRHLKDHGETTLLRQAKEYLDTRQLTIDLSALHKTEGHPGCNCPGSIEKEFTSPRHSEAPVPSGIVSPHPSALGQWPVQLHLLNPTAGYIQGSDLLLASDCSAFASGDFHARFLKGKRLAIACPKLDSHTESYIEKLRIMIEESNINTLTVLMMEVPCCGGLLQMARIAREKANRKIPIKAIILTLQGEIKSEEWIHI